MSPALTMFEVTPDHPVPISPQGGTATVTVLSGDTLYYADTPQVSAANNQGSVTAGNVQAFINPAWVRSASLSTVLAQVTPPAPFGVPDTSTDPTSPIVPAASPRNRALRDYYSLLDFSGVDPSGAADSTAAIQTALGWCSARGAGNQAPFKLAIPSGATILTGSLTPTSWVDIHAHGAVIKRNPADTTNHSIFFLSPNVQPTLSPITHFYVRGGVFLGTGTEQNQQGVADIRESAWLLFEDCEIHNVAANGISFGDVQYGWMLRNKLFNVGPASGVNALNFVNQLYGATQPMKHIWAVGNHVENCPTIGINLVTDTFANRTDPDVDAHFTDNTCISNGGGWPMAVESGGTPGPPPNVKNIDISGNTLVQLGTANPYGLGLVNDSGTLSNDPLCISGVTVRGNRIFANVTGGIGIFCHASRTAFTGNYIEAAVDDILLKGHGTAIIAGHTITGHVGHFGTGKLVNVQPGVDTTQLSGSNTQ